MSSTTHAHDDHGHGHGGPDHVPHVLPLPLYLKTYGALLFLTVLTVAVSYVNLGTTLNLIIALGVATVKAVTVAALFMHLLYDDKFFAIIIGSSILFLAIFLAFTMFDTNDRGIADPIEHEKPADVAQPFKAMRSDAVYTDEAKAMKDREAAGIKSGRLQAPAPAAPTAPAPAAPAPAAP